MVELVDTADSKSAASRRAGSIPALGTSLHRAMTRGTTKPAHLPMTAGFFIADYVQKKYA
jgi:hypothetical protein